MILYHYNIENLNKMIIKPNKAKAIMLAKRQLPEFVCDAVNLK